jgi:hypothetical protein
VKCRAEIEFLIQTKDWIAICAKLRGLAIRIWDLIELQIYFSMG